ncbi:MAG: efflux RND transporter periplasmic adaptor subunit [Candidatus Xenobiia bacterium LiM19]
MRNVADKTGIFFTLLIITGLIAAGCGNKAENHEVMKVSVQVVTPQSYVCQDTLTFPGTTTPPLVTTPSFLAAGKIREMNFNVGEQVRKGEILAELDPEIYQNQLRTASSSIEVAEANLDKVNAGSRIQQKEVARQQMLQAQHGFELAETEKNRFQSLYDIDAIPKRQYDAVATQYRIAQDQLKSAKEAYDLTKEGASKEDKQIARANVNLALSGHAAASTQLSYTRLVSPVDGVITEKKVEVGVVVGSGVPVYEIRSADSMDFAVMVPSVHINKIFMGQKARIFLLQDSGKSCTGIVSEIKPSSEMPTSSYRVKLKLSGSAAIKNYSGLMGKAVFSTGGRTTSSSVPCACLQRTMEGGKFHIFIINDSNEAVKIPVKVIRIADDRALIQGGFTSQSKVVLSGQEYLKDGKQVVIVDGLDSQKNVSPDREAVHGGGSSGGNGGGNGDGSGGGNGDGSSDGNGNGNSNGCSGGDSNGSGDDDIKI